MTGASIVRPTIVRSPLIATIPDVVHGVTNRVPGLGRADGNLGYSAPRDRADAWRMRQAWARAIGVDHDRFVVGSQIHGVTVMRVDERHAGRGARPGSSTAGFADALITNVPNLPLLSLHADCVPILFVDPDKAAIGVAHAGWRGTTRGIAAEVVGAMAASFGSEPIALHVYIGPAIGSCCYEVGDEVLAAWRDLTGAVGEAAVVGPRSLDLPRANLIVLEGTGVSRDHIDVSEICTSCAGDDWFSHRGQGPATGRFGAIIQLTARDGEGAQTARFDGGD